MKKALGTVTLVLSTLAILHCGGSTTTGPTADGDGGTPPPANGRTPAVHRPAPVACDTNRPPGTPGAGAPTPDDAGFSCAKDADCTAGSNGRCISDRIGPTCTYDACVSDADCAQTGGGPCICRSSAVDTSATYCAQGGDCHVDDDCGAGGACSPSYGSCGRFYGVQGYFCHTASDACVDDADCGPNGTCIFQPTAKTWSCLQTACAG